MRRNRLTKQRRTLRSKQPENKIETEQEFKKDLRYRMEQDALHPYCDCPICQEAHKMFKEELDAVFAKYGLVIDRDRKSQ